MTRFHFNVPTSEHFLVHWSETGDYGYAVYRRVRGDVLVNVIAGDGSRQEESRRRTDFNWVDSAMFMPLTQDQADACYAVAEMNPDGWSAFAEGLFT